MQGVFIEAVRLASGHEDDTSDVLYLRTQHDSKYCQPLSADVQMPLILSVPNPKAQCLKMLNMRQEDALPREFQRVFQKVKDGELENEDVVSSEGELGQPLEAQGGTEALQRLAR
eukprot:96121-Pelagomonas_calceolata.AAC.5